MRARTIILIILVSIGVNLYAQTTDMKKAYRVEDSNIVLYLDKAWPKADQERLLDQAGLKELSLDTLWTLNSLGQFEKDGWKLHRFVKGSVKIYKPINSLSSHLLWNKEVVLFDDQLNLLRSQTAATFGFNEFKKQSVVTLPNGSTRFFIRGNLDAEDVYLAGTFNVWSTLSNPMTKTDSGWVTSVNLQPGKHCYKFIVDGRWISDPENRHSENDFHDGYNSVYFLTNYTFKLRGYTTAREVSVAGSFNKWNEKQARLQKTSTGWELPVYLKDGSYDYKFIVDKNWITDPANTIVRDDSGKNKNSYLQLGEPHNFTLKGSLNAREVFVAGNFNKWNPGELAMKRTTTGWELPYVLPRGNYQYKFIVDGEWITDPQNAVTGNEGNHTNSVVSIKPNHTFILKGKWNARNVEVAGNFNNWSGYTMRKTAEGWMIDVYLDPGKCLYKFVVDGEWIVDPGNPLWEQNEFHNGNSVLWIGQQ